MGPPPSPSQTLRGGRPGRQDSCGGRTTAPQNDCVLLAGTCVSLDTADGHKFGVVLDRAQCHHKGACRRKAAGLESEKENCWQEPRAETERNGSEGGRRGQEPRAADGLGKPGSRAGEEPTLVEPPEGAGPAGASMSGRLTPGTARQATACVGIRKRGNRERTKPRSHFVLTPSLHFHFRVKQGAVGPWFAVPLPPRQRPAPPSVSATHVAV